MQDGVWRNASHLQKIELFQSGKDIASKVLNIVWIQFSVKQS